MLVGVSLNSNRGFFGGVVAVEVRGSGSVLVEVLVVAVGALLAADTPGRFPTRFGTTSLPSEVKTTALTRYSFTFGRFFTLTYPLKAGERSIFSMVSKPYFR